MKTHNEERRKFFLKSAILASAALTLSLSSMVEAQKVVPTAVSGGHLTTAASGLMLVSLRSNLYDAPDSIELPLDTWSNPIQLKNKGVFRVKVLAKTIDQRFGPVFTFILADANGKEFDRMNLGNSATGTFGQYGIQVYIAAI